MTTATRSTWLALVLLGFFGVYAQAQTSSAPYPRRTPELPLQESHTPTTSHVLAALSREAPGPCDYKPIDLDKPGVAGLPFQNPGVFQSNTLEVKYTDKNTKTLGGCGVKLRSFNGELVGPTIRVKPGDVLKFTLVNDLPTESAAEVKRQFDDENDVAHIIAKPHSFNTTNLHFHGLHVSPSSKVVDGEVIASDDVLIAVPPQSKQRYELAIPQDHPTGTFWYHPHVHGSTAVQVGSGMAGALIVEDDPAVLPKSLAQASTPEHEKIMVFQSILYNSSGEISTITSFFPSPPIPTPTNCKGQEGTWECSQRMITINGQIIPIIKMQPGEVQRWRMIDAGFRESLLLQLDDHTLHEIALDGIYTGYIDDWSPDTLPLDLEPGYRSDVLVQAKGCGAKDQTRSQQLSLLLKSVSPTAELPTTGKCVYGLWNRAAAPNQSLRGGQQRANLLAIVEVSGGPVTDMSLPSAQDMSALRQNVNLPVTDISGTATGVQQVTFKLGQDPKGDKNYFQVNYESYDPSNVRRLLLNATEQWNITTVGDPANFPGIPPLVHVFHIHVNPFQYSRLNAQGNPELVWKDTLLIPAGTGTNSMNVYTTYKDFTGQFVMHCHILDHEDLGMMEVDEVVKNLVTPMKTQSVEMLLHNH